MASLRKFVLRGAFLKYVLNGSIISAVFSGIAAWRQQRKVGTDWRTYLTWIAWLLTLIVAIGSIKIDSDEKAAKKAGELPEDATQPAKGPKPAKDPR